MAAGATDPAACLLVCCPLMDRPLFLKVLFWFFVKSACSVFILYFRYQCLYLMILLSEVLGGLSLLLAVSDNSCGLFLDCDFIFSVWGCVYVCVHVHMGTYMCLYVCLYVCVCTDPGWPGFRVWPPSLVSVCSCPCSRCHQSGTRFFVSLLAWRFLNHPGSSQPSLNAVEDRPVL